MKDSKITLVSETLLAYTGCYFPEHMKRDFQDMKDHACTSVLLWITEFDLSFSPKAKIAKAIKYAHDVGLRIYADLWGFGNVFCHNARGSQFVEEHIDTWHVGSDDCKTPIACVNNKDFRSWMERQLTSFISSYPIDGFVWDEIHFDARGWPKVWHCRCETCKRLFYENYGSRMPRMLTDNVARFRQNSMIDFVRFLCDTVKKADSKRHVSICLYPEVESPGRFGTEDWERIAEIPSLDSIGTDPYWVPLADRIGISESPYQIRADATLNEHYRLFTEKVAGLAKKSGKRSAVLVQACSIPAGRENEVYKAAMTAAQAGADIIAAWAYMDESFTNPSDNPRLVFENLTKAFAEALRL